MAENLEKLTRRDVLKKAGLYGGGLLAATAGANFVGKPATREVLKEFAHGKAESVFEAGMNARWHKLAAYPGLIQIDPSVKTAKKIFGDVEDTPPWAREMLALAVRPIGVRETLLRNIADQSELTQNFVNRVIYDIPERLLAVRLPDSSQMAYFDAEANEGLIIPIDNQAITTLDLPIYHFDASGAEIRDGVAYPYAKSLGVRVNRSNSNKDLQARAAGIMEYPLEAIKPVETVMLAGHSRYVANATEMTAFANEFYYGIEPIEIPRL